MAQTNTVIVSNKIDSMLRFQITLTHPDFQDKKDVSSLILVRTQCVCLGMHVSVCVCVFVCLSAFVCDKNSTLII